MSFEALFGIQGVIAGAIAWLLKVAYERQGCMKRIEQKIDSFIDEYRFEHKKK